MGSSHRAFVPRNEAGGGANRDRIGDLLVANQTLSQLSYGPLLMGQNRRDDFVGHYFVARRQKAWFLPAALSRCWWVWEELHPRPHPYQGCALTN